MKYQIKKVGIAPKPYPLLSTTLEVMEANYLNKLDELTVYNAFLKIGIEFKCEQECLGEYLRDVIVPSLQRHMYEEFDELIEQLRIAIYEQDMQSALHLLNELLKVSHRGPEFEFEFRY